jgi:hypothetical protein
MTMEMISQGYLLWAVAIEYVEGSETGRTQETVTSTGKVIGWAADNRAENVVVPLIAWHDGPQVFHGGILTTSVRDLGAQSVLAYGDTPEDAEGAARHLMLDHINDWRRGK